MTSPPSTSPHFASTPSCSGAPPGCAASPPAAAAADTDAAALHSSHRRTAPARRASRSEVRAEDRAELLTVPAPPAATGIGPTVGPGAHGGGAVGLALGSTCTPTAAGGFCGESVASDSGASLGVVTGVTTPDGSRVDEAAAPSASR
eukprot:5276135-Pyramimonas_sp.AAC.1